VGQSLAPKSQISVKMLIARLAKLDQRPRSPIRRNASTIAHECGLDSRELLHMAIDRAMRPNTSRPNMSLEPYLTMLMRSIGSGIAEARRRADERHLAGGVQKMIGPIDGRARHEASQNDKDRSARASDDSAQTKASSDEHCSPRRAFCPDRDVVHWPKADGPFCGELTHFQPSVKGGAGSPLWTQRQ